MKAKTLKEINNEINDFYKIVKLLSDYFDNNIYKIVTKIVENITIINKYSTYTNSKRIEELYEQLNIIKEISLYYKNDNFINYTYNEIFNIISNNLKIEDYDKL